VQDEFIGNLLSFAARFQRRSRFFRILLMRFCPGDDEEPNLRQLVNNKLESFPETIGKLRDLADNGPESPAF
jgi:hypothetical protein